MNIHVPKERITSGAIALPQPVAAPTHTTRRALVASLAMAPIAGVPAIAGAISAAPMSKGAGASHRAPQDRGCRLRRAVRRN